MIETQHSLEEICKRILELKNLLTEKQPKHLLLNLVEINDIGICYTKEFGTRYNGLNMLEGLNKYIDDLDYAVVNKA